MTLADNPHWSCPRCSMPNKPTATSCTLCDWRVMATPMCSSTPKTRADALNERRGLRMARAGLAEAEAKAKAKRERDCYYKNLNGRHNFAVAGRCITCDATRDG